MQREQLFAKRGVIEIFFIINLACLCIFYVFNLVRSIFAEVGVSDEGFLLNQVNGRAVEGIKAWYLPYTDFLSPVWSLSGGDVSIFRFIGICSYLILLVPSLMILATKSTTPGLVISIAIVFSISGLGLSRYLLVTPGYQYLSLVFSICMVIPALFFMEKDTRTQHNWIPKSFWILTFMAAAGLLIFSSRATGGSVYFLVLWLVFFLTLGMKKSTIYIFLIGLPTLIFVVLDISQWRERLSFGYLITQLIDPQGYSVISECIDISGPLIPILSSFLIGYLRSKPESDHKGILGGLLIVVCGLGIFLQVNRLSLMAMCLLVVIFTGKNLAHHSFRRSLAYFLLLLLPYLTVFGSNTPAAGNLPNVLIGLVLVFLYFNPTPFFKDTNKLRIRNQLPKRSFLIVALLLLSYIGLTTQNSGYGKQLSDLRKENQSHTYLPQDYKLTFLRDADLRTEYSGKNRILDLTFFNPGLIFYVDSLQFPVSISYGARNKQLKLELLAINRSIKEYDIEPTGRATYILAEIESTFNSSCTQLSEIVGNKRLARELKYSPLEGEYKVDALIEKSSPKTVFGILKHCP